MYFNQNPNDNHDTQPNLNHSTYHYTGPEWNGRERSGEPKPGFFQRRKDAGSKPPKQKKPSNGRFGADMAVELLNDGPVTLILDTDTWAKKA